MFNVLPNNLKALMRIEYRERLYILLCVLLLIIEISAILFLLPSYAVSLFKEKDLSQTLSIIVSAPVSFHTDSDVSSIPQVNRTLQILNTILKYPSATPLFEGILSRRGGLIHITEMAYTSSNPATASISIKGVSDTRESLVSFIKSLQSSGLFTSVDLPVSNLAKDKNINFSMSVSVTPPPTPKQKK